MVSVDTIKAVIADQEQDFKAQLANHIIGREFGIEDKEAVERRGWHNNRDKEVRKIAVGRVAKAMKARGWY